MVKSLIYYTTNLIEEPIYSAVQRTIKDSGLPIVSVSHKPAFGENIVVSFKPCYVSMIKQIILGLSISQGKYVFFCEHDVLYPKSHFDFTPPRDDIYYYNENVLRWDYPKDRLIGYDRLISLSGLCANRELLLRHYLLRLQKIRDMEWVEDSHEPSWLRKMGYEPGTKKIKRGGISDEDYGLFKSDKSIIDIRHRNTFSPPKVTLDGFKHLPNNFREYTIKESGWDLWNLAS